LQCIAVHCSALQCIAVHCSALQCIAVHCSALQCIAVCCNVLNHINKSVRVCARVYTNYINIPGGGREPRSSIQVSNCATMRRSICENFSEVSFLVILQSKCSIELTLEVCCSVLQCVVVCCSVL